MSLADQADCALGLGPDDLVEVFQSWINTLTELRNLAAHHGQLLRMTLRVSPDHFKPGNIKFGDHKAFFGAATVINCQLNHICGRPT